MAVHVSLATVHDDMGMPMMGTTRCAIECTVDMHDNVNLPYSTLHTLFELSNGVTRDKVKPTKIEFWQDENQADASCTYTFQGWISNFVTGSGGGGNHTLSLSIQPALDSKSFINVTMGNWEHTYMVARGSGEDAVLYEPPKVLYRIRGQIAEERHIDDLRRVIEVSAGTDLHATDITFALLDFGDAVWVIPEGMSLQTHKLWADHLRELAGYFEASLAWPPGAGLMVVSWVCFGGPGLKFCAGNPATQRPHLEDDGPARPRNVQAACHARRQCMRKLA